MIKNEEQNFKKEKKLLKPKNDIVFQSLFSSKNEKSSLSIDRWNRDLYNWVTKSKKRVRKE